MFRTIIWNHQPLRHILELWMEGRAPGMEVAANILNKQMLKDDKLCSSSLGVGCVANNLSP
jgi:hypothetical protein